MELSWEGLLIVFFPWLLWPREQILAWKHFPWLAWLPLPAWAGAGEPRCQASLALGPLLWGIRAPT